MPTSVFSCLLRGLEGRLVEVQVDVSTGVPGFFLVGLAATSVREARERVRAAIRNSGLAFPQRRLTINLAPAEMRKEGSGLDLAMGVAVSLAAAGRAAPERTAFLGELALDGAVRHTDGVLVAVRALRALGFQEVFVPPADAAEASLVDGVQVRAGATLAQVVDHLLEKEPVGVVPRWRPRATLEESAGPDDLAEVHGQAAARRALEVAAAGGHHLLFNGPPGSGKTMLARCLPGLLPALSPEEALEVAQVRSVLGELEAGRPLEWRRPFRAPHHAISAPGLIGGGSGLAAPGEISRAHLGVLFLDEVLEFAPATLQALRQPIEQGRVSITRSAGTVSYPCRFQLVAATNPCPCGWAGDSWRECRCTPAAIDAYQRPLSGPLLDRIDLNVTVTRAPLEALSRDSGAESTASVRARVLRARELQHERQPVLNAELRVPALRRLAALDPRARRALERWGEERGLTARGFHRAWRVARTLADLAGEPGIAEDHVLEALGYRLLERAA